MKTFGVITPTTGAPSLKDCLRSMQQQECVHYIVVDGQEHMAKVNQIMLEVGVTHKQKLITLEENVGKAGGNFYGHRVYAASPFLVNTDVVCFLDQDNTVAPNYIEEFQKVFEENKYSWAYTLRSIMDSAGNIICPDNCESLGHWPVAFDATRHHIDTGCFAIPRPLLTKVAHHWYGQWGADRQFLAAVKKEAPEFGCTRMHTINYRMGSETSRATIQMFQQGNSLSEQTYMGERNYPWHEQRKPKRSQMPLTYHTTSRPPL